jgi:hypothetical protein
VRADKVTTILVPHLFGDRGEVGAKRIEARHTSLPTSGRRRLPLQPELGQPAERAVIMFYGVGRFPNTTAVAFHLAHGHSVRQCACRRNCIASLIGTAFPAIATCSHTAGRQSLHGANLRGATWVVSLKPAYKNNSSTFQLKAEQTQASHLHFDNRADRQ